jgi:hypothetical protein
VISKSIEMLVWRLMARPELIVHPMPNVTSLLVHRFTVGLSASWYNYRMKKKTKPVRVSVKAWEAIRQLAFKTHRTMGEIVDELLSKRKK